jgi:hypothetical protein
MSPGRRWPQSARHHPADRRRPGGRVRPFDRSDRRSGTLATAGRQTFPTGGQITVVSGPAGGVTGISGTPVGGTTMFAIAPKGRSIAPA